MLHQAQSAHHLRAARETTMMRMPVLFQPVVIQCKIVVVVGLDIDPALHQLSWANRRSRTILSMSAVSRLKTHWQKIASRWVKRMLVRVNVKRPPKAVYY